MPERRNQRPYNVEYYRRNREAEIRRVTSRQRATLGWLRVLRSGPCLDCGRSLPPFVMDFDHRDPTTKCFDVAAGKSLLKSRAELEREIAKCDIVCANCHRVRTHLAQIRGDLRLPPSAPQKAATPRRLRDRDKNREVRELHRDLLHAFRRSACFDCGVRFPWYVMEFDHRDGTTKESLVNRLAGRAGLMRLLEEIEKCDIVCANCHRLRTYARREAARISAGVS